MTGLVEFVAGIIEALRRRTATTWVLRGLMLASGLGAQLWLVALRPSVLLVGVGLVALLLGVAAPRTILPLVTAVLIVVEAAAIGVSVLDALPVAAGLAGWHLTATALALGRPWARISPSLWRGLASALAVGMAAIVVAVPLTAGVGLLRLPGAALVTVGLVLVACVGAMIVLWPTNPASRT